MQRKRLQQVALAAFVFLSLLLISYQPSNQRRGESEQSQCGRKSLRRGAGQRVVSFSFYGPPKPRYLQGVKANLAALRLHFPGWLLRLYVDHHSLDPDTMDQLMDLASDPAMDLCIGLEHEGLDLSGRNGMLWRFLPLLDQLVDVVLVRDLDSRLSAREAAAVADWLNDTQFAVHVMRDHPSHSWPMLGGMWGARFDWEHKEEGSTLPLQDPATGEGQVPSARSLLAGLVTNMLHSPISWASVYLADQVQLQRVFWPAVQDFALVHASHHCHIPGGTVRPFPTKRPSEEDNWVGAVAGVTGILTEPCPRQCRPKQHLDWELC